MGRFIKLRLCLIWAIVDLGWWVEWFGELRHNYINLNEIVYRGWWSNNSLNQSTSNPDPRVKLGAMKAAALGLSVVTSFFLRNNETLVRSLGRSSQLLCDITRGSLTLSIQTQLLQERRHGLALCCDFNRRGSSEQRVLSSPSGCHCIPGSMDESCVVFTD